MNGKQKKGGQQEAPLAVHLSVGAGRPLVEQEKKYKYEEQRGISPGTCIDFTAAFRKYAYAPVIVKEQQIYKYEE
mgnify:CR=1 FL=1